MEPDPDVVAPVECFKPDVYDWDRRSLAALLRGFGFHSDSHHPRPRYVSASSVSRRLIQQVQSLLLGFGIKSEVNEAPFRWTADWPQGWGHPISLAVPEEGCRLEISDPLSRVI